MARVRWPFWPFRWPFPWPQWFNGNPLFPYRLPGPGSQLPDGVAQPRDVLRLEHSLLAPELQRQLPDLPHGPGWLEAQPNHQVGNQPERAHAVMLGHTVTGAYLLGDGLPVPSLPLAPRLTPNLEAAFHYHPVQSEREGLPLGPEGPIVSTGVRHN